MTWFRSLIFLIFFYTLTPLSLAVYILLLPFNRSVMQNAVGSWARLMSWGLRVICGCKMEIRGRENIPDEPVIFASKHQSAWETYVFYMLYNDPAYVLKKELMSIPVWGWLAVRADHIPVDREAGMSALKAMVRDVKTKLSSGRPVIIFPEGTRTEPGEDTLYHPGIAALYTQVDAPVVPVALNSGMFWGRKSFMKYPGKIVIEFLKPMPKDLKRKPFMSALKTQVDGATDRLCQEAKAEFGLAHIALPGPKKSADKTPEASTESA